MFSGYNLLPDSKESKLGSSNQEVSSLSGKNNRVVLVSCCTWKCVPTAFSIGVDISKVHRCHLLWVYRCHLLWVYRCHLLWEIRPEWRSQELLQKRLVSHELSLPFFFWCIFNWWIMVVLSKGYKPDNFESHNSLKLSFTNMWGICLNFVECESSLNVPPLTFLLYVNHD